jgi:hypothetical protein
MSEPGKTEGRTNRKFTPELRRELQLAYGAGTKTQISAHLDRLERRTGWPRYIFKTEARRQGWNHARRPWTIKEDSFVREHVGAMSIKAIARSLKRSHESIRSRVDLVQAIQQTKIDGYTPADLVKLFGSPVEKVRIWFCKGLLGSSRSFDPGAHISGADLLRFIERSFHEYDLRTVDQEWFKAVIFEGKG